MNKQTAAEALRSTLGILWQEADRHTTRNLLISLGFLIVGSTASAVLPVVYKSIIDLFAGPRTTSWLSTPGRLIAVYAVLQLVLGTSTAMRQLVHGTATQRLNRRLRNRLFAHIVRLPLRFHLDRKTGAVGETINQGLNGCQILLQHAVFTVFPVIIEFLAIVIVLIHMKHAAYLGIIAVSGIAYGLTYWRAAEGVTEPSRSVSKAHVAANATLTDSLLNYETVKYFDGEGTICDSYDVKLKGTEAAWRHLLRVKSGYEVLLGAIYTASVATALGYSGYETFRGAMTVGGFVLVNTYVTRLFQPLQALGLAARDMSQGLAFLQQMLAMLEEKVERSATVSAITHGTRELPGALSFDRVSFSYKEGRAILRDVSFSVAPGRTVAIVGTSGSGKSSLIRLLFRLFEPDSGRILLDGVPIAEMPLSQLRRAIGIVPQDTVLFNDTIGSNIGFGRPGAKQDEIERATQLAHLHSFVAELPDGYETEVGERGLKLSGGEKQRVAIARAALKKPSIYVFDEATSSLDSRTEREILQNINDLARRNTTLIIAHRLSTVVHADEILVLDHGHIIERGTHSELLRWDGSYASLWREQQGARHVRTQESAGVTFS